MDGVTTTVASVLMGLNVGEMKAVFPSDNLCSETGINDFKFKSVQRTILIT